MFELRKIKSDMPDINRVQDQIAAVFRAISGTAPLDHAIIAGVELAGAATNVPHLLGRVPQGYIIIGRNANAQVWDERASQPASFLRLVSSAAVTVTIFVF